MRKYIATVLMLTFIAGIGLYAQKKEMGPGHKKGPGQHHQMGGNGMGMGLGFINDFFLEKIGVNEENRKKIREIQHSLKKEMMDMQFQMHEKMLTMKKEFEKTELDEAKLKEIANEVAEMRKQQHLKIELNKIEIMKLLTVEQRKELGKYAVERMEHFKQKMKENMGRSSPNNKKNIGKEGPKGHQHDK